MPIVISTDSRISAYTMTQPKNQPTYKYICIYIYMYTMMILVVFGPPQRSNPEPGSR